jgi:hypothetical protein
MLPAFLTYEVEAITYLGAVLGVGALANYYWLRKCPHMLCFNYP